MATLEERIRDLEVEIAEYRDLLTNAPPKNKLVYANLITSRGNNRHDLNQQLQQQGEVIYLPSRLSI
jgi:hypothetical protein